MVIYFAGYTKGFGLYGCVYPSNEGRVFGMDDLWVAPTWGGAPEYCGASW